MRHASMRAGMQAGRGPLRHASTRACKRSGSTSTSSRRPMHGAGGAPPHPGPAPPRPMPMRSCFSCPHPPCPARHRLPTAYRALLGEVVRRRGWQELYSGQAARLAEHMARYREKEMSRRTGFASQVCVLGKGGGSGVYQVLADGEGEREGRERSGPAGGHWQRARQGVWCIRQARGPGPGSMVVLVLTSSLCPAGQSLHPFGAAHTRWPGLGAAPLPGVGACALVAAHCGDTAGAVHQQQHPTPSRVLGLGFSLRACFWFRDLC